MVTRVINDLKWKPSPNWKDSSYLEMNFNLPEKLSLDYYKLFENSNEHNVIIEVGEAPFNKTYKTHSVILCYRCPFLYRELQRISCNKGEIKFISKKHIPIKAFDSIIRYIYSGVINLKGVENSTIFDLLLISNEFELSELVIIIESYLIKSQPSWLRLNFFRVLEKAFEFDEFQELRQFCNNIINKHPSIIFCTRFKCIPESVLLSILERDDLQIQESVIWQYIIKWGIAQDQTLQVDVKKWTKKEFENLKFKLQRCLPHIRYFQVPIQDILPFSQILEPEIWTSILRWNLTPDLIISSTTLPTRVELAEENSDDFPRCQRMISSNIITEEHAAQISDDLPRCQRMISSNIITEEHAAQISSWIDKKDNAYTTLRNPYTFELILSGYKDGFEASKFWDIVDKKKKIVVIFKVDNTDEIIGGYNPIGWDRKKKSWQSTPDSFIFSLRDNSLEDHIISRVKDFARAIDNSDGYAIRFGASDLESPFNSSREISKFHCKQDSYEKPIRDLDDCFVVDDYEVFQVQPRLT